MTWGMVIDTRHTLGLFILGFFVAVIALFLFVSILAYVQILTVNPVHAPPISTAAPIQ
jgi:hypothetical protein